MKGTQEVYRSPDLETVVLMVLSTAWVPGQGVRIDYGSVIEILIQQLDGERMCILFFFWLSPS